MLDRGQHMVDATGLTDPTAQLWLLDQLVQTLRTGVGEGAVDAVEALMALLTAIGPKDGVEGMLAAQMVATHEHAMECLRRAMVSGQSFEGRDLNLKHATKLLQIYARQVEALDKHRGKGQQKITVEHVTVEAGGQAIVGNVQAGEQGKTPALTDERSSEALSRVPLKSPRQELSRSEPDQSADK